MATSFGELEQADKKILEDVFENHNLSTTARQLGLAGVISVKMRFQVIWVQLLDPENLLDTTARRALWKIWRTSKKDLPALALSGISDSQIRLIGKKRREKIANFLSWFAKGYYTPTRFVGVLLGEAQKILAQIQKNWLLISDSQKGEFEGQIAFLTDGFGSLLQTS